VPVIVLRTPVAAPPSLCFDLARDVEFHQRSTAASRERAVGGVTSGLLGPGDEVTWEATHFGVRQRLTSRITEFEPPRRFVDEMVGPWCLSALSPRAPLPGSGGWNRDARHL